MAYVPLYRDEAIVLRTHKLGEADRIITMLTRGRGCVRAVAKGVRRTSSRFGARLEPGMHVDVMCYEGRSLDTVTQVHTVAPHVAALSRNYVSYTTAAAMLELAERLTDEREPATQQFLVLAGALRALTEGTHSPALVLDAYLLRAIAIGGWAPSFDDCAKCGAPGPHRWFHIAAGGSLCEVCKVPGAFAPDPALLTHLAALLTGDWQTADATDPGIARDGSGLVAAFVQWHLERGVRSLRHVERP